MTREQNSPQPTDEEWFREALTLLVVEAKSKDIPVSDRSWKCNPDDTEGKWDIGIFRLSKNSDS